MTNSTHHCLGEWCTICAVAQSGFVERLGNAVDGGYCLVCGTRLGAGDGMDVPMANRVVCGPDTGRGCLLVYWQTRQDRWWVQQPALAFRTEADDEGDHDGE